uniref:Uncharacterized protein n=1 Tax=Timema tahoe TaxID=61484 RepID=A0A7R9NXU3_9NEOP|nr:unnamed protein product [Timema tahoe]
MNNTDTLKRKDVAKQCKSQKGRIKSERHQIQPPNHPYQPREDATALQKSLFRMDGSPTSRILFREGGGGGGRPQSLNIVQRWPSQDCHSCSLPGCKTDLGAISHHLCSDNLVMTSVATLQVRYRTPCWPANGLMTTLLGGPGEPSCPADVATRELNTPSQEGTSTSPCCTQFGGNIARGR